MKTIYYLLVLFITVVIINIIFLQKNHEIKNTTELSRDVVTVTKVTTDTVYKDRPIKTKRYIPIVHDTVYIYTSNDTLPALEYLDTINDSSVFIMIKDTVLGTVLNREVLYKVKNIPTITKTIEITDSVFIVETKPTRGVYITGGALTGSDNNDLIIGLDYYSKKRLGIGYSYGIINKSHLVNIKYKLGK